MKLLPENMPGGWAATTLGEVTDYGAPKQVSPQNISPDAWILELEDIEKDTSRIVQRLTFAERGSKSNKAAFGEGDVLYGKLRPYLNKVVVADAPGYCTTEVIPVTPSAGVETRFIYYALKTPAFLSHVAGLTRGINMPRLTTESARAVELPLPPFNEQRRIVAKLDALFERSRNVRDKLDRIPTLLDKLRKSILQAAINGRLSRDFRGTDELISWTFEQAADVCAKVQSGSTPKQGFLDAGVPFLKVYNIVEQKVDFDYRPQYVHPDVHRGSLARSIVYPGDVLMNIVGPPLGKVAVVRDDYPEWNINQAITVFRPSERVTSGWLYLYLCSGDGIEDIIHETKGIVGQVNISLSQCRDFVIPVPPVDEQDEIVRLASELLGRVEKMKELVRSKTSRITALEASALGKAFRGKLVPQDPSDEPASVLLERIRAERECDGSSRRRRTGR